MLVKRPVALAVLAAGLVVAGAGGAGLALTRHPVATIYPAAAVLPAPTGPIAAVPEQGAVQVSPPVALTIPSIGVQTSLVDLGLTATGALQVPPSTAVAGWYTGSPRPGAVGSAVIAGHIDSRTGPGVFYHLSSLRPGDRVYVRRADGTLAAFRVTVVRQYLKDDFPTSVVYGAVPDAELRLITCGGTFDYATGHYLSNTVAYAVETS
jgi:LPXTG-site transpeptidase (sortase) family protein